MDEYALCYLLCVLDYVRIAVAVALIIYIIREESHG